MRDRMRSSMLLAAVSITVACGDATEPSPSTGSAPIALPRGGEARPVPAVAAIVRAFDRYRLVAIGEAHGLQEGADLVQAVIRHPEFPRRAQAVAVEVGNARYQDLMDRYVRGERVDPLELRKVWRDLTVIRTGDAPIYARLFATVREVNQRLPAGRRLRVLLGEPPIDWNRVQSPEQHRYWLAQRDAYFARVLETHVFARGLRALLVCGGAHLNRGSSPLAGGKPELLMQLVERRHPRETFVIGLHLGFGPRTAELEPRLAAWPRPSLALLKGTWLGALDAGLTSVQDVMVGPDGAPVTPRGPKLEEQLDAYLYLGPVSSLTMSHPPPSLYRDEAYVRELDRRHRIMWGRPLDRSELLRTKPRGYVDNLAAPVPPGLVPRIERFP